MDIHKPLITQTTFQPSFNAVVAQMSNLDDDELIKQLEKDIIANITGESTQADELQSAVNALIKQETSPPLQLVLQLSDDDDNLNLEDTYDADEIQSAVKALQEHHKSFPPPINSSLPTNNVDNTEFEKAVVVVQQQPPAINTLSGNSLVDSNFSDSSATPQQYIVSTSIDALEETTAKIHNNDQWTHQNVSLQIDKSVNYDIHQTRTSDVSFVSLPSPQISSSTVG